MVTKNTVQLRRLGRTHIQVSPIGLGVMEMSGGGGLLGHVFPIIPQEEKNAIIKSALDGGINWFDTAELYGVGESERSLSAGLKASSKPDKDVFVATKWWPLFRSEGNIGKTIEKRLHFLDGYTVGNYMVHQPYSFSTPEAEMNAMADLVDAEGGAVGVSCFSCHGRVWAQDGLLPVSHTVKRGHTLHRPGLKEPFTYKCTDCHGADLRGSNIAPSCYKCRGSHWKWKDDPGGKGKKYDGRGGYDGPDRYSGGRR